MTGSEKTPTIVFLNGVSSPGKSNAIFREIPPFPLGTYKFDNLH
jgi:hypothetical protein